MITYLAVEEGSIAKYSNGGSIKNFTSYHYYATDKFFYTMNFKFHNKDEVQELLRLFKREGVVLDIDNVTEKSTSFDNDQIESMLFLKL